MAAPPPPLFPEVTDAKKHALLVAYAKCGRITEASRAAKVLWRNHYNWIRDDPVYAAAFAEAKGLAVERLEDEAYRRAEMGSDTLLIFLLKGAMPAKYRERYEHTGADGAPLQIVLTRRGGSE